MFISASVMDNRLRYGVEDKQKFKDMLPWKIERGSFEGDNQEILILILI
jgi:hypothetical protein